MLIKYIDSKKKKFVATTLALTLTFSSSIAAISSFKANAEPTLQTEIELELKEAQAALAGVLNKSDIDWIEYYKAKTNLESIKSKLDTTKDVQSNLNTADAETDNYAWDKYDKVWDEYKAAEAKYEAAKTEYEAAEAKYEAALKGSEINYQEYATTKTNLDTARASLEAAKAELETAKAELETAKAEYKAADDKLYTAEEEYEDSLTSGAEEELHEAIQAEADRALEEAKEKEDNTDKELLEAVIEVVIAGNDEVAAAEAEEELHEAIQAEEEADKALEEAKAAKSDNDTNLDKYNKLKADYDAFYSGEYTAAWNAWKAAETDLEKAIAAFDAAEVAFGHASYDNYYETMAKYNKAFDAKKAAQTAEKETQNNFYDKYEILKDKHAELEKYKPTNL